MGRGAVAPRQQTSLGTATTRQIEYPAADLNTRTPWPPMSEPKRNPETERAGIMKRALMATALLFLVTTVGCQSKMGGACPGGQCGLMGGGCPDGSCGIAGGGIPGGGAAAGGPLAGLAGQHRQGPQSHLGATPGPAQGQAMPTYGYPYYTTRGPRDFLNPNPPSIGR